MKKSVIAYLIYLVIFLLGVLFFSCPVKERNIFPVKVIYDSGDDPESWMGGKTR